MINNTNLFCIPHAGGLASFFNMWDGNLKEKGINLFPLEMKGHGSRYNEKNYNSIEEAAEDVFKQINKIEEIHDNSNYALLGHSMGSYILLETLNIIYSSGNKLPTSIFLSGKGAPCAVKEIPISKLPDNEFIKRIKTLGEISDNLEQEKELLSLFTPTIKSDYRAVEKYNHNKSIYIPQDNVFVLNGIDDIYATGENISAWQKYFPNAITCKYFNGGHFFIKENNEEVLKYIVKNIIKTSGEC